MIIIIAEEGKKIHLGRVGENEARAVRFDIGKIQAEFPGATFSVLNMRPEDPDAYPVNGQYIRIEGNYLYWTLQSGDLTQDALGECELKATVDGVIVKSVIWTTEICPALDGNGTPPEPWESWQQQVEENAQRAEAAAEDSEAWANGERGGEPVEDDDPAYHNNAKYWADQAEETLDSKADKTDTVLNTTLSRGRKANTTVGQQSFAFGYDVEASGAASHAEGYNTKASGTWSHAEGDETEASGQASHAEGYQTKAKGSYQHVSGVMNVEDNNNTFAEIVGNGFRAGSSIKRANARALDWNGNEYLKGDLYVQCDKNSQNGSKVAKVSDIPEPVDISGKADKVEGAVAGNFAGLDENGNLTDSGSKASDFLTEHQDISGKADKVSGAVSGNLAGLDGSGNLTDSGKKAADFVPVTSFRADEMPMSETDPTTVAQTATELKSAIDEKAPLIRNTVTNVPIASVPDGADGLPLTTLRIGIDPIQAGSGDPSHDNIRPISGWTGANVPRTGKNLFVPKTGTFSNVVISKNTDGSINLNGQSSSAVNAESESVLMQPGTYRLSCASDGTLPSNNKNLVQVYGDGVSVAILNNSAQGTSVNVTISKPTSIVFRIRIDGSFNYSNVKIYPQLELGSTASEYEAYSGQTYPISWQTEAGTVYGAEYDLITGVMTVTDDIVDMGSLNYGHVESSGRHIFRAEISDIKPHTNGNAPIPAISTMYKAVSYNDTWANGDMSYSRDPSGAGNKKEVSFVNNSYSDANTFKTAMTGQKVCFKLATPLTYQLDPITVRTLLGQNNVWADTGNIIEMTYPCDTKLYIDKKLAELTALVLES